jgi:hypothetical protein
MTSRFIVSNTYKATTEATVELPDGIEFESLNDWHVRWDSFFYQTEKGGPFHEIKLESDFTAEQTIDFKEPASAKVCSIGEFENAECVLGERS